MKKLLLGAMLLALAPAAQAGAFTDTLSVCLVKKTSDADKQLLVRWIFAALAQHPAVKDFARVSKEDADKLNADVAGLYQSLLVDRCRDEARDALQYDGNAALESSFEVLGRVATQGLMTDPKVSAFIAEMSSHVDEKALDVLSPAPASAPAPPPPPAKK